MSLVANANWQLIVDIDPHNFEIDLSKIVPSAQWIARLQNRTMPTDLSTLRLWPEWLWQIISEEDT